MLKDSYHGYAATDFYKIDRRYGTNEEYRAFCEAADKKGIKIIMDMIMNHCGSEHWFVKDPPTSDWLNLQDNYVQTSHRRNTNQDIHASEADKKAFSDGWFVETMPDLNQRNELMATYLIQNTLWWIEYSGVSGIRMDTYPYPDKYFMADWTCAVLEEYPNVNIVGEEWTTNPAIVAYWQKGKVNHDGYTSCLPSVMDFPLQNALTEGLIQEEKRYGSGLIETYKAVTMDFLYADPYDLVIFPDNHDMDRFFTQVAGDYDLFKMGMIFFATMRGVPQFYYGTEILMHNDGHPGDHGIIRTDFPGGWPEHQVNAFTGEGLTDQQKDAQVFTQNLLNWRKSSKAIHQGELIHFAPEDGIYVYFRMADDQKVMVVMNKNDEEKELDMARFHECLLDAKEAKDILGGKLVDITSKISLAGKKAYIFEL
jgi:glycosidase